MDELTYRSNKEGGGGLVKDNESEVPAEVANNMVGRIGCAITECLVGLDHQNHLIGRLGQPILLPQTSQVVQGSLKQAEDLILNCKGPAISDP